MSLFLQEKRNVEQSVFGLKAISNNEYNAVYETTGLDLDGRLEVLNNCMMYQGLLNKKLICFLKSIPGFKTFDIDDQICLTKGKEYVNQDFNMSTMIQSMMTIFSLPFFRHFKHVMKCQFLNV